MFDRLRSRFWNGRLDTPTMRRVEAAAALFDVPEGRFLTAGELLDQAAAIMGAPLRLCYTASPRYTGSLLGTAAGPLVITIDESYRGGGPIETLVAGHELGHALGLDDGKAPTERVPVRIMAEQVPDLPPELLAGLLMLRTRCGGRSRAELACEYFGTLLVSRSMPPQRSSLRPGTTGMLGLDSSMGGARS
ncbi:hypothetical protein [Nocardia alni]|uniref:hypothetical protein n=1 Tax=Nocardia alni TaxID=2815723 RepID=UPI001C21A150|nr:hypothetical protein [Nocardia alni]